LQLQRVLKFQVLRFTRNKQFFFHRKAGLD
jgi:hypothetical protein